MKKITSTIKQEMLFLDDSYERLKLLKDKYKDETAYIVTCGPSLKNYNQDKLKKFLKDKFVLGVKQSYDILEDIIDIHLLNFCNSKPYNYKNINNTIINWIVFMADQPPYIINNNIPCDFMMPLIRNGAGYENTIAAKKDFENLLIDNSFARPWGSGIMYESALPLALYCGVKDIVTLGWDIGSISDKDKGKTRLKYDHFYAEGKEGEKTSYDGINVIKYPVGGSAGMSYHETKIVIDSTKDLYDFLQSINVNLSIVSDRNPAHKSIPRIEIPEIL